jgi:hypothetical protein
MALVGPEGADVKTSMRVWPGIQKLCVQAHMCMCEYTCLCVCVCVCMCTASRVRSWQLMHVTWRSYVLFGLEYTGAQHSDWGRGPESLG